MTKELEQKAEEMTIKDLRKALEQFPDYARVKVNFGPSSSRGDFHPENSPILDIREVKESQATHIVYLKVPYNLVCHNCGRTLREGDNVVGCLDLRIEHKNKQLTEAKKDNYKVFAMGKRMARKVRK